MFVCISNFAWEHVALLIGFLQRTEGKCCSGRRYWSIWPDASLLKAWCELMSPSGRKTTSCRSRHRWKFGITWHQAIVSRLHNDITLLNLNGLTKAPTHSGRNNGTKPPQRQQNSTAMVLKGDGCHQRYSCPSQQKEWSSGWYHAVHLMGIRCVAPRQFNCHMLCRFIFSNEYLCQD